MACAQLGKSLNMPWSGAGRDGLQPTREISLWKDESIRGAEREQQIYVRACTHRRCYTFPVITSFSELMRHMRRIGLLRYFANVASYFKQAAKSLLVAAALMPLYVAPASHAMVNKTVFTIVDAGQAHPVVVAVTNHVVAVFVDWRELRRWKLDESKLLTESAILFRNTILWSLHKWTLLTGLLIIVALSLLTTYLLIERKKLKQARKAQEKLSGMLISAQEDERSRIACEIHDDFSQRMAVLALGLGTAAQTSQESPEKTQSKLLELTEIASSISSDLHTLSHRLHSATLESLGLAPGVNALCKEFSAQQGIKIDRTLDQVPRSVAPDAALCIFRIVQESLRNVKKHSEASSALVSLQVIDSTIHLSVSDQGKGFNPKRNRSGEGLGIRSMEERVRSLGGRIEIRSKEGMGTKIEVWLPLHTASAPETV